MDREQEILWQDTELFSESRCLSSGQL